MEIEELGYNIETHGQKGFNGVAILSKRPIEVARGLPGDDADVQSRYIEAVIPTDGGVGAARQHLSAERQPVAGTEKYPYKLAFMERLIRHAQKLLEYEEPLVLAGDFNVIPDPLDAAQPELWKTDALFLPETRAKHRELLALGFADALRATTDAGGLYTFWDYQAGAWQKNNGIRIDHLLLSPQAADRLHLGRDRQGDAGTRQGLRPHADPHRVGDITVVSAEGGAVFDPRSPACLCSLASNSSLSIT